ncbi:hypothetical protein SH2C18_00760 [Clostridium sediminicola]
MMESHPELLHISEKTNTHLMLPLLVRKSIDGIWKKLSIIFIPPPEGLRRLIHIPAITTQDKKWGKYTTD